MGLLQRGIPPDVTLFLPTNAALDAFLRSGTIPLPVRRWEPGGKLPRARSTSRLLHLACGAGKGRCRAVHHCMAAPCPAHAAWLCPTAHPGRPSLQTYNVDQIVSRGLAPEVADRVSPRPLPHTLADLGQYCLRHAQQVPSTMQMQATTHSDWPCCRTTLQFPGPPLLHLPVPALVARPLRSC